MFLGLFIYTNLKLKEEQINSGLMNYFFGTLGQSSKNRRCSDFSETYGSDDSKSLIRVKKWNEAELMQFFTPYFLTAHFLRCFGQELYCCHWTSMNRFQFTITKYIVFGKWCIVGIFKKVICWVNIPFVRHYCINSHSVVYLAHYSLLMY